MDIQFGTGVYTEDGEEIGRIKEVILDPVSRKITHLVIQRGLFFENDSLIWADDVAWATPARVMLKVSSEEAEKRSAEYSGKHFVDSAGDSMGRYWTRPQDVPPSLVPPGLGGITVPPDLGAPEGEIMLPHGCPVHTSDDEFIGRVLEFITDEKDQITHIVIKEGALFAQPRLVPVDWIDKVEDNEIRLSVDRAVVDQLKDEE